MYPDAVDDVEKVLEDETDPGARRNAFVMLFNASQDRAIAFLAANTDKVLNFGDGFALILLELIRKLTRAGLSADATGQAHKSKFIRIVFALLENPSPAVAFEAASTLTTLSAAAPAIRAAAGAYIKILNKESDSACPPHDVCVTSARQSADSQRPFLPPPPPPADNVKLIVLEKIASLRKRHSRVLREQIMDILRVLSTPNTDIRRKTLDVAMDLVSPRNVEEVMAVLKKDIISTGAQINGSSSDPESIAYRSMLISAIHGCA